jgi:STE24 endopeptidase
METAEAARRYHRIQLALRAAGLALSAAYLTAVLLLDTGRSLDTLARSMAEPWWWRVAVVSLALGAGHRLLTFPLGWLRGWLVPRRFGLSHQPLGSWLGDVAKSAALSGLLGLATVEIVFGLWRATAAWWLVAAAVFFGLSAGLAALVPVLVVPLFYRLTPLTDEALRERLLGLARKVGVTAAGVWVVDQSRKGRTANAFVAGLGRTRRIVLFDTLVSRFEPDEIESVLAHELGHDVHRDLWRGLVVQGALTLLTFFLADATLRAVHGWAGFAGPGDPAAVPWMAAVLGLLGLAALPVGNTVSRRFERQADDFAVAVTGNPGAFIGAMERLASLNLARRRPPRIEEIVLHSHPALDRRIERARQLAT